MKKYLTGKIELDMKSLMEETNPLSKHFGMLMQLINDYGTANSQNKADTVIRNYVNKACEDILECTAVFKNTKVGQEAFDKFLISGLNYSKF